MGTDYSSFAQADRFLCVAEIFDFLKSLPSLQSCSLKVQSEDALSISRERSPQIFQLRELSLMLDTKRSDFISATDILLCVTLPNLSSLKVIGRLDFAVIRSFLKRSQCTLTTFHLDSYDFRRDNPVWDFDTREECLDLLRQMPTLCSLYFHPPHSILPQVVEAFESEAFLPSLRYIELPEMTVIDWVYSGCADDLRELRPNLCVVERPSPCYMDPGQSVENDSDSSQF